MSEQRDTAVPAQAAGDWTRGGADIVYQRCGTCSNVWYFARSFCPRCGAGSPASLVSQARGTVHAATLVHRAPSDEFRALAPYRMVLVDLAEGFRIMAHGQQDLAIGDAVRGQIRQIAGRAMPYFTKDAP